MLNQGTASPWGRDYLNLALVWNSILSQEFVIVDNVVPLVVCYHWTWMSCRWVCSLCLCTCWHDFCWLVCLLKTLRCYRFDVKVNIILESICIWSIAWNRLLRDWLILSVRLSRCIFSSHESLTCIFYKMIKCTQWFDLHCQVISCCLRRAIVWDYDPRAIIYVWILVLLIAWGCYSICLIVFFDKSRKPIEYPDSLICHLLWHLLSNTHLVVLWGVSRSLCQSYHVHRAVGFLISHDITLIHRAQIIYLLWHLVFGNVWNAPPASPSNYDLTCADYLAVAILWRILSIIMKVLIIRIQLNSYSARWWASSVSSAHYLIFSPACPIWINRGLCWIQVVLA